MKYHKPQSLTPSFPTRNWILMKSLLKLLLGGAAASVLVPALIGQMKLSPSDEWFALACENIKVDQAELLKRDFRLWIDADKMAIHGPFSDLRKRKLDSKYAVDAREYLSYLNTRLLNKRRPVFVVKEVTMETGWGGVTATEAPVFSVKINGIDSSGRKLEVERAAKGPAYSVFKVHNVVSDPVAIRSANIACFAAFLRVALELDKQLGDAAPSKSPSGSAAPRP